MQNLFEKVVIQMSRLWESSSLQTCSLKNPDLKKSTAIDESQQKQQDKNDRSWRLG